jgi:uncharacterized protein YlzI (FlbEa/FlbD family)
MFVKFNRPGGGWVYICPASVASVEPYGLFEEVPLTKITLSNGGYHILVKGTVDDVIAEFIKAATLASNRTL